MVDQIVDSRDKEVTLWEIQRSYHNNLIMNTPYRGNELSEILRNHAHWIENSFVELQTEFKSAEADAPIKLIRERIAAQLSRELVRHLKLKINKSHRGVAVKAVVSFIPRENIDKYRQPISPTLEMGIIDE